MIAHYGYADSSGEYFITVDTSKCSKCNEKKCLSACPKGVFVAVKDDYGDDIIMIKDEHKRSLENICSECKPKNNRMPLLCVSACPYGTMEHSW